MDPFDLAQTFIERALSERYSDGVQASFRDLLERLGFRYFACCSHVDPSHPPQGAVVLHNYPQSWEWEFYERKFFQIDPVLMHAERTLLPFHWQSDNFLSKVSEAQRDILERAAAHGLRRGFTIPIHLPWKPGAPRASCSVVADSDSIGAQAYLSVQLAAMYLYNAAWLHNESLRPPSPLNLSGREKQCLELAAHGKSDWAIGQILKISEHTVHFHIERAKKKLGVSTRLRAILSALEGRQISLGDVIRSERSLEYPLQ